ncbi:MAG: 4-(cytidine 5'-diphospho)-2-C-methyl-D-erythritol kinase [Candidatus Zixiibacteriota bacterium]|nr:MAG: 4-(cytidine 5'-diphospho)-2-C-methyl-D-erythritol kinase [candidate division Zixibacteria bacterium]
MIVSQLSDTGVTIDAPAKINLFLEVLNKRPDGYHDINSVFQAVSLYDRLEFTVTEETSISIDLVERNTVSAGKDNLIALAYQLMKERYGLRRGLKVRLEKRIPVAAGLGGGSSDGAATIAACNMLFKTGLEKGEMMALSAHIGSDMPFFFSSGQAHVSGRGEELREVELPTDYAVVLVNPSFGLSTSAGYASLKRDLTMSKNPFNLAACPTAEELIGSLHSCGNDFEEVHVKSHPELGEIRDELSRCGASLARMTGSGPTMFGLFYRAPDNIKEEFVGRGNWQIFTVLPVTLPAQV